jgi:GT2 family glycosyltransferase
MDYSDIDLAIDFLNRGFPSYVAPSSMVFHKYKFKMNPNRLFILECGRYQLLGHFRMKTLLLALPALIITELIVWSFILTRNRTLIKSKIKVHLWFFTHFRNIFRNDNTAAKDLKLLRQMTPDIMLYDELSGANIIGHHPFHIQKALNVSNHLFRFTRRFLINSLDRLERNSINL